MTVETYGEHSENAARALNRLIGEDTIPVDPAAVDQMLHCREAVVDALRQRLYGVGLTTWRPTSSRPVPENVLDLAGLDNKLATLLDNIAFSVPSLPIQERLSPVDVLGKTSTDPVVETWREAAIELLAATHALDAAGDKPWLRDQGAGWYVMRDVAAAMDAVLVLEALQPQVSHLVDLTPQEPNMRRFWQQGELTAAVTRMQDQGTELTLQPHQMLALANATHEVTHNLGRSLRREMLRTNSKLRDGHPRHEDGPVRVGRGSRLGATLTHLINMPAPTSPVAWFNNPLQRAALRKTLDMTPTASQPPPRNIRRPAAPWPLHARSEIGPDGKEPPWPDLPRLHSRLDGWRPSRGRAHDRSAFRRQT